MANEDWQGELVRGRLQALSARVAKQQQAVEATAPGRLLRRYKKVQGLLDVVKIISLATMLFTGGLDGFSLGTFLVVANGELLATLFVPYWQMQTWRKVIIIVLDILIMSIIIIVVSSIAYIHDQPSEACEALGGAWTIAGKLGVCKGFQELFDALL